MSAASMNAAEWRAAGTDLSERRRHGISGGKLADIAPSEEMLEIACDETGARIGAAVSLDAIAGDAGLAAGWPGLAAAAGGLATPQIRRVATLGGNLAQRSRCWYFRNPDVACLKKGGEGCPARNGNHLYGVAFDTGPCAAPHPSTMAAALLACEAKVTTDRREGLGVDDLLGDGRDGADNALAPGELIVAVTLPPPVKGERAGYRRATGRARSEWPLVELVTRARVKAGRFEMVRLAAGGIAPVPLRLEAAEAVAEGAAANPETTRKAAGAAIAGASPLPMTGYKLRLLEGLVRDGLERCLG